PPGVAGGVWTHKVIYRFTGGADGASPQTGITLGPNGMVYSTTSAGGELDCYAPFGCGVAFEVTPPRSGSGWTERVIHTFTGGDDGSSPTGGPLLMGVKRALLGTTVSGGNSECFGTGCGTIFQLIPPALPGAAWTET